MKPSGRSRPSEAVTECETVRVNKSRIWKTVRVAKRPSLKPLELETARAWNRRVTVVDSLPNWKMRIGSRTKLRPLAANPIKSGVFVSRNPWEFRRSSQRAREVGGETRAADFAPSRLPGDVSDLRFWEDQNVHHARPSRKLRRKVENHISGGIEPPSF